MADYSLEDLQAELENREVDPTTRQQQAVDYFQTQGWAPHQAAGIVGNLFHESGMKTSAVGDRGASLGLAQWGGGRRKALHEYAASKGSSPYDFNTQLEFINQELTANEAGAGNALRNARNTAQATQIFSRYYERPGKPMMGSRLAAARRLEKMMDITGATTPSGQYSLEDLEAELARREGTTPPQADYTLEDLEAELKRREAGPAAAEKAGAAVAQAAMEKTAPPKPAITGEQVISRLKEPLSAETAFEPPVFPERQVPVPPPVPQMPPDPRLVPGATVHPTTGPEPPAPPMMVDEKGELVSAETFGYPPNAPLTEEQIKTHERAVAQAAASGITPEMGRAETLQYGDPINIVSGLGGIGAALRFGGATGVQALKAMGHAVIPFLAAEVGGDVVANELVNTPVYARLPLELAGSVLAGVLAGRFMRMGSPTVLRQTVMGGKPVEVSPQLFDAEIKSRITAGMKYPDALRDVAQKYGSSLEELLRSAGSVDYRARGTGAEAGGRISKVKSEPEKPTTGKEETFVTPETPTAPKTEAAVEPKPPTRPEVATTAPEAKPIPTEPTVRTVGEENITVAPEGGAYRAYIQSDQHVKVPIGELSLTPQDARAGAAKLISDPDYLNRLSEAKGGRLTFQNLVSPTEVQTRTVGGEGYSTWRPSLEFKELEDKYPGMKFETPPYKASPTGTNRVYTVYIDKSYFPKELQPKGIGEGAYETVKVKADSRTIAALRAWDKMGRKWLNEMEPFETTQRKISLHVDEPSMASYDRGKKYMGGGAASRLTPIEVLKISKTEPVQTRTVGEVYQDPDGWYRIEGSENKFNRKVEADKAAATIKKYQDVFEEQLAESGTNLSPIEKAKAQRAKNIIEGEKTKYANELAEGWKPSVYQVDDTATRKSLQAELDRLSRTSGSLDVDIGRIKELKTRLSGHITKPVYRLEAPDGRLKPITKTTYDALTTETPSVKPFSPILDENGFIDMNFLRAPVQYVNDLLTGFQRGIAPGAISPEHLKAAEVAGSHIGPMHRRGESSAVQLKPGRRLFDKMGGDGITGVNNPRIPLEQNEGIQFMSDMSMGRPVAPKYAAIRDKIQEQFALRLNELRRVGKPINDVRANYFPGMWDRRSRLAFNQAMDEAIWTQNRGLATTGDPLPAGQWSTADKAWVRARTEELIAQGNGSQKDAMIYLTKRPLAGKESFRKPKVFEDIMTGIEFGLKPISNNPVDLALLKMAEMDRSIWAHGVMKELKGTGNVKFLRTTQKPPPGFVDLKAGKPYAEVYGPYDPAQGARPLYGRWVAKEPTAQIIDNFLSQSLYNDPIVGDSYRGLMFAANLLNQWQLMSFFHAGFTTFETQISHGAQVLKDIYGVARGNRSIGNLMETVKQYPTAASKFARQGNRTLSEWANPSINVATNVPVSQLPRNTHEAAVVAKAAELAGGGFGMERRWQTHMTDKFIKDFYGGNKTRAALRSPVVFSEMMMKPVLEWLVPRQKAAVFGDLVGRLLEQNPNKSLADLRPQLRQAWNRVDARLGQVRYDRLFMKEGTKNLLQALVRAPGWTGGTITEIGGAPIDTIKWVSEFIRTGRMPADLPDRVAYTLSLLGTMAMANGATTLVYDKLADKPFLKGNTLQEKIANMDQMDWFAFRTGQKHPDGRDIRYLYPSYMKDLFAWQRAPGHTAFSKLHPVWSLIHDLYQNKDYYSTMIANPKDPWPKRYIVDTGGYVLKNFIPFGVRGMMQVTGEQDFWKAMQALPQELREEPGKVIAPQFGIMPAPRAMTATPFMLAMDEAFSRAGKPTLTPKEAESMRERHKVVVLAHKNKIDEAEALMDKLREKGELTKAKEKNLRAKIADPQAYLFKQVKNIDDAIYAWSKASPEEKEAVSDVMDKKLINLRKHNRVKYNELEDSLEPIFKELEEIGRKEAAQRAVQTKRMDVDTAVDYIQSGASKQ